MALYIVVHHPDNPDQPYGNEWDSTNRWCPSIIARACFSQDFSAISAECQGFSTILGHHPLINCYAPFKRQQDLFVDLQRSFGQEHVSTSTAAPGESVNL